MRLRDALRIVETLPEGKGGAPWLAVGRGAARALRASGRGPDLVIRQVRDIHRALEAIQEGVFRGCVIEARRLTDRPSAALEILRQRLGPDRLVVIGPKASASVRRACQRLGVGVVAPVQAPRDAVLPAADLRRADESLPTPKAISPGCFAKSCLEHLADPGALIRHTARVLGNESRAGRVSLMLVDEARRSLSIRYATGLDDMLVGAVRCRLGRGLAGRAAVLGRPLAGHGTRGGPRGYAGAAYVVLPLGRGTDCEGVINLTGLAADTLPDAATLRRWARICVLAGRALATARRLERAEAVSRTDPLTNLPNRRAFESALARELDRAARSGDGLAVALFDADRFKRVNDEYGHPAGDRVLVEIARRLVDAFRESDLVARWGGEEFAVLLPGLCATDPQTSLKAIERARRRMAQKPAALGPGLPARIVTVSCGVAFYPGDGHDGPHLVKAADGALFEAKEAGRNTIRRAGGPEPRDDPT